MAGTPANPLHQVIAAGKASDGTTYQLRVDSEGRLIVALAAGPTIDIGDVDMVAGGLLATALAGLNSHTAAGLQAAGWTLEIVPIAQSAAGSFILKAAATGKINALFKLFMTLDDDADSGTIQVKSGAAALTGAMPYSKFAGPADDCGIPGLPLTAATGASLSVAMTGCGGCGYAVVGQKDA